METHITVNRNTKALPTSSAHSFTAEAPPDFTTRGAAQQQGDDRRREISRLIVAAHAGYGTQAPQDEAMAVAVEVWKDALDAAGIPNDQLRPMLTRANAGRGSNYPPSVSEIIAQWHSFQSEQPRKTFQESESESGRAALPQANDGGRGRTAWKQLGERLRSGDGNVLCECKAPAKISSDGFDWICGTSECAFAWPTSDTLNAPHGGKPGPLADDLAPAPPVAAAGEAVPLPDEREYSDAELIEQLEERCEFQTGKVGHENSLLFARHLQEIAPVTLWTAAVARGAWQGFQAAKKAVAA